MMKLLLIRLNYQISTFYAYNFIGSTMIIYVNEYPLLLTFSFDENLPIFSLVLRDDESFHFPTPCGSNFK
jgi:hypothetical protein